MNFFDNIKVIFNGIAYILGHRIILGSFSLTLGSIFIGILIICASCSLLNFLFEKGGE